jgi:hypothetical protein
VGDDPRVTVLAHHLALALAVFCMGSAALRVASLAVDRGLVRVVAAYVLAASAMVLETLAFGLVGLGSDTVLLTALAVAAWLVTRAYVPRPAVPAFGELVGWWSSLRALERAGAGAVAGAWLAWVIWLVGFPLLGIDALMYHLPETVAFVQSGRVGTVEPVLAGFPVGNYPLTNEVLLTWFMGISRSFAPAVLWAPLLLGLFGISGLATARALRIPRAAALLAVGALGASPTLIAQQGNGPTTDLAAVTWLAACGALCLAARSSPRLLPFAVLAAGLCAGTKTTTVLLVSILLVATLVIRRASLRRQAAWLGIALGAAVVVGGTWYVRNTIDHGSPIWPFAAAPWGDPVPPTFARLVRYSFLDRPWSLSRYFSEYRALFAGDVMLLIGVLAWVFSRTRAVLAASGFAAVGVLVWLNAPATGLSDIVEFAPGTIASVRYLLPALSIAAVALMLAARETRSVERGGVLALLAAALVWNVAATADLGDGNVPSLDVPLIGACAGAAIGVALARVPRSRLAPAALALAVGVLMVPIASGFAERHAKTNFLNTELVHFFVANPTYRSSTLPVATPPPTNATLAGDQLQHRLEVIGQDDDCPRDRSRARAGWVVARIGSIRAGQLIPAGALGRLVPAVTTLRCFQTQPVVGSAGQYLIYSDNPRIVRRRRSP